MRIYTEVNYIWKDNKLVETDSKSFEYEGEVDQCHKKWHWHTHASINDLKPKGGELANISDQVSTTIDKNTDTISQEFDRWDKAHKTNLKYAKEWLTALLGGGGGDGGGSASQEEEDDGETSPESGLGTRGTMAGRNTVASASTSKVRRDINKQQGLAPTLINQRLQKRLQA